MKKDDVIKVLESNNLSCIEIYAVEYNTTRKLKNLDDLIKICKFHNKKYINYFYEFMDSDDYYITEWELSEDDFCELEKLPKHILRDIEKHNNKIDKIDFDKPIAINIIVSIGFDIYTLKILFDWYTNFTIDDKFTFIEELIEKYEEDIDTFESKTIEEEIKFNQLMRKRLEEKEEKERLENEKIRAEEERKIYNELKEYILNHKGYNRYSTRGARNAFATQLLCDTNIIHLLKVFKVNGKISKTSLSDFIEYISNEEV